MINRNLYTDRGRSMLRIAGATLTALLLAACTPSTLVNGPSAGHLRTDSVAKTQGTIPQPIQQSIPLPRPRTTGKTETYSVVVNNVKVQDLLFALARDAKLNVDIHPGIAGYISLNAIDQTLPQILNRISKQVDMRFELDGPNLAVMPDSPYLKNYQIDYINITRDVTGTVSTNTQISTGALTTSSGSAGSSNISRIQIENKSKNRFWESLEKNLKDLLHETDKIFPEGSTETVMEQNTSQSTTGTGATPTTTGTRTNAVNQTLAGSPNAAAMQNSGATVVRRMTFREAASVIASPESGVITVRATSRQHEKVQEFIDQVMRSAKRQVLIEATIIEVDLNDNYQQGINWTKAATMTGFSLSRATNTATIGATTDPFGLTYRNISGGLEVIVDMLKGFGTTKVLSSPKLTVLNNQTATLKVSEEFVYFNVKQDVVPGNANTDATTTTTTTPQSVSIGFFMSLTAQISDDDVVTLNVRPSISSIAALKQDPNPDLKKNAIKNEVPQIRTREIESMLRVHSGEIAVLGGLMEDRMDNRSGRFPGVGDIPIFGEIFTTRNNASSKSELVVVLRPTVIKDASIGGDFDSFSSSLPGRDFFRTDKVYQPFSRPEPAAGAAQMSLLMDALRKADEAKRLAGESAVSEPNVSTTPELSLKPMTSPMPHSTKSSGSRLPDLSLHLDSVDADLAAVSTEAPVRRRASASAQHPASTANGAGLHEADERTAARNVFTAKQPRRTHTGLWLFVGLGALAIFGIGGYFWWQLRAVSGASLSRPAQALPAVPAPPLAAPPQVTGTPASAEITAALPATPPAPRPLMTKAGTGSAEPARPFARTPPAQKPPAAAPQEGADNPVRLSRSQPKSNQTIENAYDALQAGQLEDARRGYEQVLRNDPKNTDALLGVATIAARLGQSERAQAFYLQALESDPSDATAQAGLINTRGQADPGLSESRLKTALAAQPDSSALHFALGNLYARQARWSEAQQAYFRAYSTEPDNADFIFNMAVSLDHLRQGKLAAQYYRMALSASATRSASFDESQVRSRLLELQP